MATALLNRAKNLFVGGTNPDDGHPICLIDLPHLDFWGKQANDHLRGSPGDAYLPELLGALHDRAEIATLVQLDQWDHTKGKPRLKRRILCSNVVTDLGAQNLLKLFTASAGGVAQYMALTLCPNASSINGSCASTLSAQITSATDLTTLNTNNGPAISAAGPSTSAGNIAKFTGNSASTYISNTTGNACTSGAVGGPDATTDGGIAIGYGLAGVEYFSGHATQSNAGNIKAAAGVLHATHNSGEYCVSRAQTGDQVTMASDANSIIYNSSASTNAATGTAISNAAPSGTGKGGRSVVYSAISFNTSSTAGQYSGLWIITDATIAASTGATTHLQYSHLSFSPLQIGSSSSITATYTISL